MNKYQELISVLKAKYNKGPTSGIFTDGGASPNPGPGGYGFAHVEDNELIFCNSGKSPDTTNNQMELKAIIEALKYIKESSLSTTIYSDSQLCVNTVNQWAKNWEKNNWKRKTGPIKNLELVKELYYSFNEISGVELKWVPGHSGWLWNEFVDKLQAL